MKSFSATSTNLLILYALCGSFTFNLAAQNEPETLRHEVLRFVRQLKPEPNEFLHAFLGKYTNFYQLTNSNGLARPATLKHGTKVRNRISLAIYTNTSDGLFYIRCDSCEANSEKIVSSVAPIVVAVHAGKMSVFDSRQISDFSQTCSYLFHGFIQQSNAPPLLITSLGPVGSGNYMSFYKWQMRADTDTLRVIPTLLSDVAHVVDFNCDLSRRVLRVSFLKDKWKPASMTEISVSLDSLKR